MKSLTMIPYTALLALIFRTALADANPPYPTITSAPSCDLQKRGMCLDLTLGNADHARQANIRAHALAVVSAVVTVIRELSATQ